MRIDEKKCVSINIREASIEDVPLILKFICELAEFEKLSDEVVVTEDILRETLFGERSYAKVIIAEIGQEPVGFIVYFYNYSTFVGRPGIYIEDIFVRSDNRSKGVGRALLKYCAKLAKQQNCCRIECAVLKWNPACKFYEQFGAKAMDEWLLYRLSGNELDKVADS